MITFDIMFTPFFAVFGGACEKALCCLHWKALKYDTVEDVYERHQVSIPRVLVATQEMLGIILHIIDIYTSRSQCCHN